MNLYATLIEQNDKWIEYCFGTSLENMTGRIHIDLNKGTYTILNYPDDPMNQCICVMLNLWQRKFLIYVCLAILKKDIARNWVMNNSSRGA